MTLTQIIAVTVVTAFLAVLLKAEERRRCNEEISKRNS